MESQIRTMLLEDIQQAIQKAAAKRFHFALFFLDVDCYSVDEALLQEAADRLEAARCSGDRLAQLEGNAFVVISDRIVEEEEVFSKAQSLITLFRETTVTVSIGISLFPKDGITADKLLRNANAAMCKAKKQGGDNFQFYTPEANAEKEAKLDQEIELRRALVNQEFFLCYQPQFDLTAGKMVAVEALLRWQHPQKGTLLPVDFIALAKETRLIVPIGAWVMRTACEQNKAWQTAGFAPMRVAVNVTAEQFKRQNLTALVRDVLEKTQLSPEYLELELTSSVVMDSTDIVEVITELKMLGVMIAIDDFGTGYSNLSYLKKIPLDRLKIDSSFVQNIQSGSSNNDIIIRAVIAMAKNLNIEVIAEGVETQEQLEFLKTEKCGDVQGYHCSRPLTREALEALING